MFRGSFESMRKLVKANVSLHCVVMICMFLSMILYLSADKGEDYRHRQDLEKSGFGFAVITLLTMVIWGLFCMYTAWRMRKR